MTDCHLLDTCAFIWMAEGASMDERAERVIRDGKLRVSPVTAWEVGLLVARGRIALRAKPSVWFQQHCDVYDIELAGLNTEILVDSSFLPGKARGDQADRIIIATARAEGMTIITRDKEILDYARQDHVLAMAC